MIGYITLGTNDLQRAAAFYDALLAEIGVGRVRETELFIAWGTSMEAPKLCVTKPYDGNPASAGNGVMVALAMPSTEQVDVLYNKAIALGAQDEGAPGQRDEHYYGAYFRDLDGNKLNAFFMA